MNNKNGHNFYKTAGDYSNEACSFLYEMLLSLQNNTTQKITIALSGGTTPLPVLNLLKGKDLDWKRYEFFMVDERCVPKESEQSNFGNIEKIFFNHISSAAYPMFKEGVENNQQALDYAGLIQGHVAYTNGLPQFDIILLGLGDDGHTASLFPGTDALHEDVRLVVSNHVPQLNSDRITLTYPVLLNAKRIIVMAKGESKTGIINELYAGGEPTAYPMQRVVDRHSNMDWII